MDYTTYLNAAGSTSSIMLRKLLQSHHPQNPVYTAFFSDYISYIHDFIYSRNKPTYIRAFLYTSGSIRPPNKTLVPQAPTKPSQDTQTLLQNCRNSMKRVASTKHYLKAFDLDFLEDRCSTLLNPLLRKLCISRTSASST